MYVSLCTYSTKFTCVYVYVYIIYHCGCTALPTRRLDHLIFVVRKTRNPLQLWDAPCSFQRVIHFSCGVEDSPRFLSSRQKRLYISSSCRHRCGTELIVLDLELPPRISSVLQLLHTRPCERHDAEPSLRPSHTRTTAFSCRT